MPKLFYNKEQPQYPYCKKKIWIDDHELYALYEEEVHHIGCPYCRKKFYVSSTATYLFDSAAEDTFL